jgi:hypothetical protein
MDLLPDSGAAPKPEIVIDGAPRRKVMRKQLPGSTTANGIEDAIEDLAAAVFWFFGGRPPDLLGARAVPAIPIQYQ